MHREILCSSSSFAIKTKAGKSTLFSPQVYNVNAITFSSFKCLSNIRFRGGVESSGTNFELILIKFFELFFTFPINRIIYRIERISNKSSNWKIWLHPIVGAKSNQTNFELIFIKFFKCFLPFRINRIANYWIERISKRIPILLHP